MGSDTTRWVPNNIISNISNPKQQSHIKTQNLHGKPFLFEGKIHRTNSKSILLLSNQFYSFCVFSKVAILCSLLLGYLLEGSNSLLSSSWLSSRRRQLFALSSFLHSSQVKIFFFFSLLVSRSIFFLPIERTLGPKPSNSL